MGMVTLRVKEGTRPIPYFDGETRRMLQPGETFEGEEQLIANLPGQIERADAGGERPRKRRGEEQE